MSGEENRIFSFLLILRLQFSNSWCVLLTLKIPEKCNFWAGNSTFASPPWKKLSWKPLIYYVWKNFHFWSTVHIFQKPRRISILKPNEDVIQSASKDNKTRCQVTTSSHGISDGRFLILIWICKKSMTHITILQNVFGYLLRNWITIITQV